MNKLNLATLALIVCFSIQSNAQQIIYSEPDRDDFRSISFDIAGKIGGNYLIYKEVRSNKSISIYDNEMKLVKKNDMDFLPEKIINSDIVAYRDFFYFIYQYQKKNIVYCMAARMGSDGKIAGEPKQLDTTVIPFFATNKIYNLAVSENKQRISVYKINTRDQTHYPLTIAEFDTSLSQLSKQTTQIPMPGDNDFLTEFALSDDGAMNFVRANTFSANGNIESIDLFICNPGEDTISHYPIDIMNLYLDNIHLQVDNVNKQCLITSLYSKQKRGNIDGIFCCLWSKKNKTISSTTATEFPEELRVRAKNEGNPKNAFNDFYLQNILMRKDGGFVVAAESAYSYTQGNNGPTRWDNAYSSPYWSNSNYYLGSPLYPYYYYPWYSSNPYMVQVNKYYADNIAVLSFDSSASMKWASIVDKSQYDDATDDFIGYGIYKTSSSINFLYNQYEHRTLIANVQSVDGKGEVIHNPTLKNLGRGYDLLPRYAKQVGKNELLLPCQYRNYLCFARIVF